MPTLSLESAERLLGLFVDFAADQPVERFVDPERVLRHVDQALTPARIERVLAQHLRPGIAREQKRAAARDDQVGDWCTPEAEEAIREVVSRPVKLDKALLRRLAQQDTVKFLLRAIVQESIDHFVHSLGSMGGSGVIASLGRGAVGMAASVGKQILGGLAPAVDEQVRKAARSFVDTSLNLVVDRIIDLLADPATAERLGRMNAVAFGALLGLPTRKVADAAAKLPLDEVLPVIPGLVAHNLARTPVREIVLAEVRAALAVEGKKTLRHLVDDPAAVAAWRAEIVRVAAPLVIQFAASPAFAGWK